ncbi:hypothetical protein HZA96_02900 [Candidatus Woesearchaeota archaeon]|nr:hypothetical protein [Candidatus Woesearchaeota archaeon]
MSVFSKVIVAEKVEDILFGDGDKAKSNEGTSEEGTGAGSSAEPIADNTPGGGYGKDKMASIFEEGGIPEKYDGTTILKLSTGYVCYNSMSGDQGYPYMDVKFFADKKRLNHNDEDIPEFFNTGTGNKPTISIPLYRKESFSFEKSQYKEGSSDTFMVGNFPSEYEYMERYEGMCRPFIMNNQYYYYFANGDDEEKKKKDFTLSEKSAIQDNYGNKETQMLETAEKPYEDIRVIKGDGYDGWNDYSYIVEWDAIQNQCRGQHIEDSELFKSLEAGCKDPSDINQDQKCDASIKLRTMYVALENPNACCGDDYAWIMNKVINYQNNKKKISQYEPLNPDTDVDELNKICLYPPAEPISIDESYKSYQCVGVHKKTENFRYDGALLGDNLKFKFVPHYDKNKIDKVTDVGLHFPEDFPLYCTHYFDPEQGDKFEWLTLDEAEKLNSLTKPDLATVTSDDPNLRYPDYLEKDMRLPESDKPTEDNPLDTYKYNVCNFYLSGRWTGSRCCMHQFDFNTGERIPITYNDEQSTHESKLPEGEFDFPNGACFESTYVDYAKRYNKDLTPEDKKDDKFEGYYGINGKVWTCNQLQFANIIPSIPIVPIILPERNYNICQAKRIRISENIKYVSACMPDNSFIVFKETEVTANEKTLMTKEQKQNLEDDFDKAIKELGYDIENLIPDTKKGKGIEIIDIPMSLSTAPWKQETDADYSSCCFANSCWDPDNEEGPKCVPESTNKLLDDKTYYSCKGGIWKQPTPKLNWYNDTIELDTLKLDGSNLCTEPYSCACPSATYSSDINDLCDPEYTAPTETSFKLEDAADLGIIKTIGSSLCTNTELFFHKDHLCEPIYDSNKIINAEWSSRTKVLAIQLLDIAGDADYTLQCGPAQQTLNYNSLNPDPSSTSTALEMNNAVNSFCVLKVKDQTYIGVTVNKVETDATQDSITFDPTELFNTQGFVKNKDFFGEDSAKCVLLEEDNSHYGLYKSCSERLYFNNKLKSIIYNKNGINNINDIQVNYNKYNDQLFQYKNILVGLYNGNKDAIVNKNIEGGEIVRKIADFNNIYILKTKDLPLPAILAITERKWDINTGDSGPESLKYFTLISYISQYSPGIFNQNINCNKIYAADPENIFCNQLGGFTFLFTKLTPEPYQYLGDLTSKLRIKKPAQLGMIDPSLIISAPIGISPEIISGLSKMNKELQP